MPLTRIKTDGITDGSILNADINSSAAVALSKLSTSGTAGSGNFLRGDGAWTAIDLTALNASNLTSGTVPDARFPSTLPAASGANLTALNGSNISSGTVAAARVATLNQNTTGSAATLTTARTIGGVSFDGSANINLPGVDTGGTQNTSGNAATATRLATTRTIGGVSFNGEGNIDLPGVNTGGTMNTTGSAATLTTARTIAGVSFDGSANISLNNNAITNGAGYLTSVATSNIADDAVTFAKMQEIPSARLIGRTTGGTGNPETLAAGDARTFLNVENGATADQTNAEIRAAVEAASDSNVFTDADHSKLNGIAASATNVTNNNQLTNGAGYITSANGGNAATLDSIDSSQFLRSDAADSASGDITFDGGAGAATIANNSDIRFQNGNWTGESCKIQHHTNYLYLQAGSNGFVFRSSGGTDRAYLNSSGHFIPGSSNTYDLGGSSNRWRNVYTNDLNLSNEGSSNDVDGTWGDYTIQEGESDLFLLNRRNGKKYKFNVTEVN